MVQRTNPSKEPLVRPTFVRLSRRDRRALERLARREDRTLSSQIRHILSRYLLTQRSSA